ncbi:MAG: hypothetical protein NTW46_02125 [Candidatus Nealsonbacteria bacterium]|nr:hypothetical protein [Candidatus Nealsonbacteria bacterium]
MKIPKKALKLNTVAEYFDKIREEKERLISFLMELVSDSFPVEFQSYLETTVLPKLLTDGRYGNFFRLEALGFDDADHFERIIDLLKEAWKGNVIISVKIFEKRSFDMYITFDPVL